MPDTDVLANALFDALTSGVDFSVPPVDLTGAEYQPPSTEGNPLYDPVPPINEAALTDRTIGGGGVFDGIMATLQVHLENEYRASRLSGKEYAQAYVSLTQAALQSAVQFLMMRDQTYYQNILAQQKARTAELETVNARVMLEKSKSDLRSAQLDTHTRAANYSLTKAKLATEEAAFDLAVAQGEKVAFEVSDLLPKEVLRIQNQIDVGSAEISRITAQKDHILDETAQLLPAQVANINADRDVKTYQVTNMLPAQKTNVDEDTLIKTYTKDFILPAQRDSTLEQMEAHRAKTLDTRSDGVTQVTGAIGKQKELHAQQITSYKRDAETKVAKMLLDTWITQKSMDEGLIAPASLRDPGIDSIMTQLRENLGVPYAPTAT